MDMLNNCGCALSPGDGSDFHPMCHWEATPPGYSTCVRAWRWLASCHGATPAWTYYGSPVKLEEYRNAGRCNWLWEESEIGLHERTLAGGPWEGATWFWSNWRSWQQHSWLCWEPESRTSTSFPEIWYPRLGRGRRKDCVHLWVF